MSLFFGFAPHKLHQHPKALGRRVPTTDEHIRRHPLTAVRPLSDFGVEHRMGLPWWHWTHDQGEQGACVGHGTAMERAVRERYERKSMGVRPITVRLDPWWIWDQAKLADEWTDTNPGDDNGTSVHAAYDVIRKLGGVKITNRTEGTYDGPEAVDGRVPDRRWSVTENQWATTVDQMRACIARNQPVTIGVNWYDNFDAPDHVDNEWYIGRGALGQSRGGHCVCVYGASDRRQAFRVKNSWGRAYPLVWLTYDAMERLLSEDGEACVVTDTDTPAQR